MRWRDLGAIEQPVGAPGAPPGPGAEQASVKLPLDPVIAKLAQAGSEYVIEAPLAGAVPPSSAAPDQRDDEGSGIAQESECHFMYLQGRQIFKWINYRTEPPEYNLRL